MLTTLAVLDTSYLGVSEEVEGAKRFDVDIHDARSDGADKAIATDGVLVQYATIDAAVLDRNPSWRVIGRYGVGYDTIDVAAASERGIAVFNVPDYCVSEVATHAAALVLASLRRISDSDRLVRDDRWGDWASLRPIDSTQTLTLGLIGLGQIGAETARLLMPFFQEIVAFDPSGQHCDGVTNVSLEELLERSDVISLHCPLMPATHHLINAERIALMKPTAHVVNVSRGGLIDTSALADALHRNKLGGAALDVLEVEPPNISEPIFAAPRTILTNHVAWLSEQSEPRLRRMLAQRCAAYLVGDTLVAPLNAQALSTSKTQ